MKQIIHEEFGIRSEILSYHSVGPKLKGMREEKPFVHDQEISVNIGDELYKADEIKFYTKNNEEVSKDKVYLDTELRIAGIIINDKNEILVLKVDRPDKNFYCFPGGHCRENESVEECLKREMKEETNVDISNFQHELIYEMHQDEFGPEKFFLINLGDNKIIYKDEEPISETAELTVMNLESFFKLDNVFPKEVFEILKNKIEKI